MALGLEVAILPGLAAARRLDSEGDWKRHLLLTPAIGLLICLGIAGISFILELSLDTLTYLLILANIFALIAIRVEINPEPKIKQIERKPWFWIFVIIASVIAITPLTFMRPMGVDWIGFASLADSISRTGGFNLTEPSIGEWLYPPAFPMLAAWLGGSPQISVFLAWYNVLFGITSRNCCNWRKDGLWTLDNNGDAASTCIVRKKS